MLTPCSLASASYFSAHAGSVAHGIRERLGDADDVGAGLHRGLDLVGDLVEVARREDAHDVRLQRQDLREVGGHGDVAVAADRLTDGAPVLLGMPVDDADEVDLLRTIEDVAEKPLAHHARAPHRNLDHASLPVRRNPETRSQYAHHSVMGVRIKGLGPTRYAIACRCGAMGSTYDAMPMNFATSPGLRASR